MDLLQSNMLYFNRSSFNSNNAYSFSLPAGPGHRLSMLCNKLGINLRDQMPPYFIYRKQQRPQNPMINWQQIADKSRKIF